MTRDSRKLLARIKAYKLHGWSHRRIADRLGVSGNTVAGLIYRDRKQLGIGPRQYVKRITFAEKTTRDYLTPAKRENDCFKHISLIAEAHGCGFPILTLPPTYRVAA